MCLLTILLAVAWARPAPAWAPPDALIDDYNLAVQAMNAGNPGEAEAILEKVVAKAPSCGVALLALGQARNRLNQPADALEPMKRAVELFPERAEVHAVLAESAFGAQQFELAEVESGKAAAMVPGDAGFVAFAVQASLRLGHTNEAKARLARSQLGAAERACVEVGIRVEAEDVAGAKEHMAACQATTDASLRSVAQNAIGVATGDRRGLRESATELGLTGYELVERGEELINAGRYAEAVPVLEAAIVALPHDVPLRVNLAIALVELGRYAEAEVALREAVASDTWVDVHASGNMSGIMTKRSETKMRELQREAAALLVRVQARAAKGEAAAKSLADARARFGDVLELVVAEAELRASEGRPADAWALLRAGVARGEVNAGLTRGIARLAVSHPDGLDPSSTAYVRANGTTVDRLNLAIAESNGKRWGECIADAEAVLAKDPAAPRAAEVGYACAVFADEPDRALPLLTLVGKGVDRRLVHDHALALQEAGRHADALALLALYPGEGETEPLLRALAVRSHVATKSWPEALAFAEKPGLDPKFLAWVGQELLRAGRKSDAARLLGGVCPQLTGKDADGCKAMLAHAAR